MNEKDIENLVNGIGSMAELTALFYKSLIKDGVDASSAAHISGDFIKGILAMASGKKDE